MTAKRFDKWYGAGRKLRKFVNRVADRLHSDSDILDDHSSQVMAEVVASGRALLSTGGSSTDYQNFIKSSDDKLAKLGKPSFNWLRELLDVIAVATVVAFGLRALFLQPFQIPTSSMQPTLFGIHTIDSEHNYYPLLGKTPGILNRMLTGSVKQSDGTYTSSGDHLFVERISHHFRDFKRGDVVVFATDDITDQRGGKLSDIGTHYIKRLVGLPGDTLKIVDNELFVKPSGADQFEKISVLAPQTSKLYSGEGGYQGHKITLNNDRVGYYLNREGEPLTLGDDEFFMLGDNVNFSSDGRVWGVVPRKNMVGRAWMVFWPFSRRWGMADSQDPIPEPTGRPGLRTYKVMSYQ